MDIFEEVGYGSEEDEECLHENIKKIPKAGVEICMDCGWTTELIVYEAEWRNYGNSEDKDMTRCHTRDKKKDRGVKEFLISHPNIILDDSIIGLISVKANQVINDNFGVDAVRGSGRIGIIAASIMFVCRENGYSVTESDICKWLKMNKRELSNGKTRYLSTFPDCRIQYMMPRDLIIGILRSSKIYEYFEISKQYDETAIVKHIHDYADWLEGTSRKLSASTPKTVAAAIVYNYMCRQYPDVLEALGISKKKPFANKVGLSEVTINTHNDEINKILDKSKPKKNK